MTYYEEPKRKLPAVEADVVVAGAGTSGVVAAIAAARQGANTVLIEAKGYPGGLVVEGGTALHSFFNLWKAFPGVERRQVVKGIPNEIIERVTEKGGTSGHAEMSGGYGFDSVCTAVDTEIYKLVAFEMLAEAGVKVMVNTLLVGAIKEGSTITGVIVESRSGREAVMARSFIDCTGYGDLAAYAGADFTERNSGSMANSMGVGGVSVEGYHQFLQSYDAVGQYSEGLRSGKDGRIVRLTGNSSKLPADFVEEAQRIGMHLAMTTTHDDYFMFIKINYRMNASPTDRDEVTKAELELRRRQEKAIALIRKYLPGCEKAFIARTSPVICTRRGRTISCDYDITSEDVTEARHFADDIMAYGFHDEAPKFQVKNGGTYGVPYRALCATGIDNLFVTGMMITSNSHAHNSTRNTVCCMGQGQGAGTAAALCAAENLTARELPYGQLREALIAGGVHLEN